MLGKQLEFLTAAAEQERVAALQAYDLVARERLIEQHLTDLLLAHRVVCCTLTHVNRARTTWHAGEHTVADERVVHDHVCLLQHIVALAREQARIAGTGANEPNFADLRQAHSNSPSPASRRSAKSHARATASAAAPRTRPRRAC